MRLALIALGAVLTIAAAGAGRAEESFFNKRYCTMGGSDNSGGMADCSFSTWEQCRAAASGLARYCTENPYWKPDGADGSQRPRPGRRERG
jgi:hypothetical protein